MIISSTAAISKQYYVTYSLSRHTQSVLQIHSAYRYLSCSQSASRHCQLIAPPKKIELVDTELEPPQTILKLGQASCVEAHIYAPVKVQAEAFTTIAK